MQWSKYFPPVVFFFVYCLSFLCVGFSVKRNIFKWWCIKRRTPRYSFKRIINEFSAYVIRRNDAFFGTQNFFTYGNFRGVLAVFTNPVDIVAFNFHNFRFPYFVCLIWYLPIFIHINKLHVGIWRAAANSGVQSVQVKFSFFVYCTHYTLQTHLNQGKYYFP